MALSPDLLDAKVAKAASLYYFGRDFEAGLILRQILAADPNHGRAHLLCAQMRLAEGDLAAAWPHWRRRLDMPGLAEKVRALQGLPEWHGDDPAGQRLIIHSEQGIGDLFLFSRWLKPLAERCASATLVSYAGVAKLMEDGLDRGRGRVVAEGAPVEADMQSWMGNLPFLTGLGPADLPAEPWIAADPARVEAWRKRQDGPGLSVGLCWAGNPGLARDEERSIPLAVLAPLFEAPGCRFFSLQVGPAEAELTDIAPERRPVALGPELMAPAPDNFVETAAAIAALDVVISVDTAIANLAGALGASPWVMLPSVAEWRWGREGDFTPWLPGARLFRQKTRYAWEPVIAGLREALCQKNLGVQPYTSV